MSTALRSTDEAGHRQIELVGRWTNEHIATLAQLTAEAATRVPAMVEFDAGGIEALDLTGAWLLRGLERRVVEAGAEVRWQPVRPAPLGFIDEVMSGQDAAPVEVVPLHHVVARPIARLGRMTIDVRRSLLDHLGLLGAIVVVTGRALASPRRLRLPSVIRHVYDTGVTAIPIVALIAFLISVIITYIGAQQLRMFGGEIFVVDLVTIAVLRELGVLLTAIIVAGRSGSAFAAEIGVMKLNDEVDALRAIGLDPVEVLVVPRVLGLVIALPLLTVVADAMGLAGGAVLSWLLVDITFTQFIDRVSESVGSTTFWVGIIKAPVFAFLIALVATLRGLQVRDSSRELGRLTTVAVVQSIFLVILFDAIFAVVFMELDI